MRIGNSVSTKNAGMSALWHDVDFVPAQHIDVPTVEKGLEEMPLPSEQQKLPEGFDDPFAKQDSAYEVAAEQMDRGIRGVEFLYGKKPPSEISPNAMHAAPAPSDPVLAADDVTRTMMKTQDGMSGPRAVDQKARTIEKNALAHQENRESDVAQTGGPRSMSGFSDATKRGGDAAQMLALGAVGAVAGQGLDPLSSASHIAQEAASVVQALTTSKLAVGLTEGMRDAPAPVQEHKRDAETFTKVKGFERDDDEHGF
jgi:hypothetical protein